MNKAEDVSVVRSFGYALKLFSRQTTAKSNKKILLPEHKRHTTRAIHSPWLRVVGDGGYHYPGRGKGSHQGYPIPLKGPGTRTRDWGRRLGYPLPPRQVNRRSEDITFPILRMRTVKRASTCVHFLGPLTKALWNIKRSRHHFHFLAV